MNDKGKRKGILRGIFRAILPILVVLLVLIFVYFLWRHYQPNRSIDLHQTHVSQSHPHRVGAHSLPTVRA